MSAIEQDAELAKRQLVAHASAVRYFDSDIWDPPVGFDDPGGHADRWRAQIDDMLRAVGWTHEVPYQGDGDVEWCGIFVGACYRDAGVQLSILKRYFPSCYRLQRYASYRPIDDRDVNAKPPAGVAPRLLVKLDEASRAIPKMPDGTDIRRGDIMIVGGIGTGPGKHITMIDRVTDGQIHTVEGNARGNGPDGKRRQGVVRRFYTVGLSSNYQHTSPATYHPRWIIRPSPADFGA